MNAEQLERNVKRYSARHVRERMGDGGNYGNICGNLLMSADACFIYLEDEEKTLEEVREMVLIRLDAYKKYIRLIEQFPEFREAEMASPSESNNHKAQYFPDVSSNDHVGYVHHAHRVLVLGEK
jgi:hypothetical protein